MPDAVPPVRPYWLPDTKGFLAAAIVLLVITVVLVLLIRPPTLNDLVFNLLSLILGIMVGCFKDVYSNYFGSTQASEDKNKTIKDMAADLASSTPVGAAVTTTTTDARADTTITTTEPVKPGGSL